MTAAANRLAGARVLITRSEDDCAEWAEELERRGARPVLLPCISSEPIDTPELRAALSEAVADADWLVLTSRRGVEACARLLAQPRAALARASRRRRRRRPARRRRATARARPRADLVGGGNAAALGAALTSDARFARGARVVLALAANASDALERCARGGRRTLRALRRLPHDPGAAAAPANARSRRSAPSASCSRARRPRAASCIKWISTCRSRSIRSGRRRRPRPGLSGSP